MREETRLMDRKSVDIIIPIYNALDDLKMCIDSVQKYTDLTRDNLILINDNSSDSQIKVYLDSLTLNNTTIIHNETNRGFSYNVNKGMSLSSDNDVILLNSDTIVTKNWVDKIYTCAYSDESIGTVTPLSNSATLCSIPRFCQDNKIPDGLSVDDMARIVEECSIQAYPRITVAVGFCMFIKREVLNITGLFDAETFEKGYGEENDFCNRAEQYGYIHVMCDDTFIYHKGTASFNTSDKKALQEAHEKYLNIEYPQQMEANSLYCQENPEQYIRDNINVHIDLANGRKNLLYMCHLDFRGDAYGSIGGTQFHLRDLTNSLKSEYNIFTLTRDENFLLLTIYVDDKIHTYRFFVGDISAFFTFRSKRLKQIFELILDTFKINIVHVQHVLGLSLDMYYAAHDRSITLISSLHDFYSITPAYKLLDKDNKYILPNEEDYSRCKDAICDFAGYSQKVDILPEWRKEFEKALKLCDKIIFPHESCMDIILSYYPSLRENSIVIHHGIDFDKVTEKTISKSEIEINPQIEGKIDLSDIYENRCVVIDGWAVLKGTDNSRIKKYIAYSDLQDNKTLRLVPLNSYGRKDVVSNYNEDIYMNSGFRGFSITENPENARIVLECDGKHFSSPMLDFAVSKTDNTNTDKKRIAFFGGMVPEKGSDIIYEMITKGDQRKYEWYIFGDIKEASLRNLEQDNLHKSGTYSRNDIPKIIEGCKIDLVCVLSTCPETFCYTISESIMCDTPILTTNIGAQGARAKQNGYGVTVPYTTNGTEVLKVLDNLFSANGEYTKIKKAAVSFKEKDTATMCSEYEKLYKDVYSSKENYLDKNDNRQMLLALKNNNNYAWRPNESYYETEQESNYLKKRLIKAKETLRDREVELIIIKNSRIYKVLLFIKKILRRK